MPALRSTFNPPWYLCNGHIQTILPELFAQRFPEIYRRDRIELDDGDFLDLDWIKRGNARLAILSHGLEGTAGNPYMIRTARFLAEQGWDVLAWNFRSCGGTMNRLPRFYHSGETGDLHALVSLYASSYQQLGLVGFSLGGNMMLKYLAEGTLDPKISAAVAVSAPIDLAGSAKILDDKWTNRIYLKRFMQGLKEKVRTKARHFPHHFNLQRLAEVRGFREFDNIYTGPLHGFANAEDYWSQCSAGPLLPLVRVPTLLLNALDDPFLSAACFPIDQAAAWPSLFLETPQYGGHLGFRESPAGATLWLERRIATFLQSPTMGE